MSEFACRLLRYMDSRGYDTCVPVNDDPRVTEQPLLDFSAGYVLRSIDQFPRAGSRAPWRLGMSYAHDVVTLRHGKINDGSMRFSRLTGTPAPPEVAGFTAVPALLSSEISLRWSRNQPGRPATGNG